MSFVRYCRGFRQQGAKVEDRYFLALTFHHPFADRQRCQRLERRAGAATARIAHRAGAVAVVVAGVQHLATFIFIARGHYHHIRNTAQEGEIERSLMRLAVCADDPGAVDSKQHRQLLDSHIVDHLIVGSLQEGGVDRHHRLVVANRQPGGEGDRMLLGNGDVKVPIGEFLRKLHHP